MDVGSSGSGPEDTQQEAEAAKESNPERMLSEGGGRCELCVRGAKGRTFEGEGWLTVSRALVVKKDGTAE